jgi:hypothetical protein
MVTCLSGLAAEFANVVIQDMLAGEVCSALNSFMEKQPTEELNPRGSTAFPDEVLDHTDLSGVCRDTVYAAGVQPVRRASKLAGAFVWLLL